MRQLFAAVAILAAVGAVRATDGEVKCKADGVHLCCAKCEKSVTEILTNVNGVTKITCDRKGKAVTFEAKDKKTADDAVAALLNGGFIGKMTVDGKDIPITNKELKFKADEISVKNVHICCGQCTKAVNALFKDAKVTVSGKGAQKDVVISGKNLDADEVLRTLQSAGFHGVVEKK